jgi:hypothetical protein
MNPLKSTEEHSTTGRTENQKEETKFNLNYKVQVRKQDNIDTF